MKFDVRGDNAVNRNRKRAAGERRRLLRDQLRDFYFWTGREGVGLRGGGVGRRRRRGHRSEKARPCRQPKNLSHATLLRVAHPPPSGVVCSDFLSSPAAKTAVAA